MRFGKNLQKSRYEPWKDHYIDYNRLKSILREDDAQDNEDSKPWTADDEQHFSDELFNVQLNKVKNFHDQKHNELKERTNKCNERLEELLASKKDGEEEDGGEGDKKKREDLLDEVSEELDGINKEIIELEKFSRLNFTGALKAVKKHDRRRGTNYKLKPMLQVRLSALQFNSEDYSPLLYRLSTMYDFVRKNLDSSSARKASMVEPRGGGGQYTSHKCKDSVLSDHIS